MLPEPYWRSPDGRHTIYHADCRDVLAGLLPGSVNAVVTDPPYGINFSEATWDEPEAEHPEFMKALVAEAQRLVVDGHVFVFQAMNHVSHFHEWFPPGWRLFAACKNFARVTSKDLWRAWDPVVYWRNGESKARDSGVVNRDYHVGNVAGLFGTRAEHPCPKPLDTMRHLVQLAAARDGLVLDPFLGSGSTSVACVQTGRRSIGIEQNERYCEIAVARMERTLAQPVLFLPERITDAQESLELTG